MSALLCDRGPWVLRVSGDGEGSEGVGGLRSGGVVGCQVGGEVVDVVLCL